MLAFPTVGVLIATRQPANAIGWLFLVTGVSAALEDVLLGYATYALLAEPGSLPAGAAMGVLADVLWVPTLVCGITFLFLLFPDGRLPARGWRWLVRFTIALAAATPLARSCCRAALLLRGCRAEPARRRGAGRRRPGGRRPGRDARAADGDGRHGRARVRFRRSGREGRQQIKWLFFLAAVFVPLTPLLVVLQRDRGAGRPA